MLDTDFREKKQMKIGVPREVWPGECRVAASPANVRRLQKLGFRVMIIASGWNPGRIAILEQVLP